MRLAVFNGSPRGKGSNTKILLDYFLEAFKDFHISNGWTHEIAYLVEGSKINHHVQMFKEADYVILAFPLYTDAMPAMVKNFIENLQEFCGHRSNPKIGFIVQSGFPETAHSRYVEKYLQKLATRLNSPYLGTVLRGGVEGIQMQPPWMTKKLFASFAKLGAHFANKREFDQEIVDRLEKKEQLSSSARIMFHLLSKLGLINFYWNSQLKKNEVFDQRFDRPYQ